MEKGRYDDIIDLPHHVSPTRNRMSAWDRAAQFSPFAALVGYDAAIREEARLTAGKAELAEDEKLALDAKYRQLRERIGEKPRVRLTWFRPDSRKEGGAYIRMSGRVAAISPLEQSLSMEDGTKIRFDDILKLELDEPSGEPRGSGE